jgi:hypothetical protein
MTLCNFGTVTIVEEWWENLHIALLTLTKGAERVSIRNSSLLMILARIRTEADLWVAADARKLGSLAANNPHEGALHAHVP